MLFSSTKILKKTTKKLLVFMKTVFYSSDVNTQTKRDQAKKLDTPCSKIYIKVKNKKHTPDLLIFIHKRDCLSLSPPQNETLKSPPRLQYYWHFHKLIVKEYRLFQCSYQTILAVCSFWELLLNNTDVFQTSNADNLRVAKNRLPLFRSSCHSLLTWLRKIPIRRCRMPITLKLKSN